MSRPRSAAALAETALVLALAAPGCRSGEATPAALEPGAERCGACRMVVSDRRFAAQVVAPGEEPRFFDDVGCLVRWLRENPGLPRRAAAYVADHRTGAWVPAARAVYTRDARLETPMMSHLVAHAGRESRAADPVARTGAELTAAELFGAAAPPEGRE